MFYSRSHYPYGWWFQHDIQPIALESSTNELQTCYIHVVHYTADLYRKHYQKIFLLAVLFSLDCRIPRTFNSEKVTLWYFVNKGKAPQVSSYSLGWKHLLPVEHLPRSDRDCHPACTLLIGGLCEALCKKGSNTWKEKAENRKQSSTRFWGILLVCLVAISHFDSPFDKTDHVFILNSETKEEIDTEQTWERVAGWQCGSARWPEGRWVPPAGEDTRHSRPQRATHLRCQNKMKIKKNTHTFAQLYCFHNLIPFQMFPVWPSEKFLVKLDFLRCLKKKEER